MNNKQDYCREYKAQDINKSYLSLQKKETLVSEVYDHAVILPLKRGNVQLWWGLGGVVDSSGEYVSLSAHKSPHLIDYGYVCENPEYCDKTAVYCGYLSSHWGHFLLDCTSRLWLCLNNKDIDEFVFIRNLGDQDTSLKGNYKEFFRLLGILDKVRIITVPTRYKKVYVPELSYLYRHYWTDEFSLPFDCIVEQAMKENKGNTDEPNNKVFFSRSHFKKALKLESGLEMLDNFFSNNGYAIYWPEEMSLSKMIYIIRNAGICAFESGTPPHNMLFARNGQKTIVVEKQSLVNNYQCSVDVIRDLDTTYVDGHYTIYPVIVGHGPFFLAYNENMEKFANNYGYFSPDSCFLSERYLKKCLHNYMKAYKYKYGEMLGFESWHHLYASAFCEGNISSMKVLKPYLCGQKLYSYTQLLSWPVMKIQLRRIFRVLRGYFDVSKK